MAPITSHYTRFSLHMHVIAMVSLELDSVFMNIHEKGWILNGYFLLSHSVYWVIVNGEWALYFYWVATTSPFRRKAKNVKYVVLAFSEL